MVGAQQRVMALYCSQGAIALEAAFDDTGEVQELLEPASLIATTLMGISNYKKADNQSNQSYLEESKRLADACGNAFAAYRATLLTLSKRNVHDSFVALPELQRYQKIAEALQPADNFIAPNVRFSSAVSVIAKLFSDGKQNIKNMISRYEFKTEYKYVNSIVTAFINDGASFSLAIRTAEHHQAMNLNIAHFKKNPPHILLTNLVSLWVLLRDLEHSQQADQLNVYIFEQLNIFLEQLTRCEHTEGVRHLGVIREVIPTLPEDISRLAVLNAKLLESSKKVEESERNENNALARAKKDGITALINLMSDAYYSFKFSYSNKIKIEVEKILSERLAALDGMINEFSNEKVTGDKILREFSQADAV
jgi:hypothetical protein